MPMRGGEPGRLVGAHVEDQLRIDGVDGVHRGLDQILATAPAAFVVVDLPHLAVRGRARVSRPGAS